MIVTHQEIQQDTISVQKNIVRDSVKTVSDSVPSVSALPAQDSIIVKRAAPVRKVEYVNVDTTSVCSRNSIIDITFYDSTNFISGIGQHMPAQKAFLFAEKYRQEQAKTRLTLKQHLKPGQDLPGQPLHEDWMIWIIVIIAVLFSLIKTAQRNIFPGFTRFFLFRGVNDPTSREIDEIFHWHSTILNLISFLVISLFAYNTATFYKFTPEGFSGLSLMFIILGIIISAVTFRHIICVFTGSVTGERDLFREYILAIYQSYRFSALFLFTIVILVSYSKILPAKAGFISGLTLFGFMYIIRVIRLLIIFINRNLSIFYLILYLCALEILPVLILVKYISGII